MADFAGEFDAGLVLTRWVVGSLVDTLPVLEARAPLRVGSPTMSTDALAVLEPRTVLETGDVQP